MIYGIIALGNADKSKLGGYTYTFSKGACGWTANHTATGFFKKLEVIGGNLKITSSNLNEYGDGFVYFTIDREVSDDNYFYSLNDLPADVKEYWGLSNGSWNKCYYLHKGNKTIIYRPNPNASAEVYNDNTLNEYRRIAEIWG